jgi:hypothetical protein
MCGTPEALLRYAQAAINVDCIKTFVLTVAFMLPLIARVEAEPVSTPTPVPASTATPTPLLPTPNIVWNDIAQGCQLSTIKRLQATGAQYMIEGNSPGIAAAGDYLAQQMDACYLTYRHPLFLITEADALATAAGGWAVYDNDRAHSRIRQAALEIQQAARYDYPLGATLLQSTINLILAVNSKIPK